MARNTRKMIEDFQRAFGRPVNESFQTDLSPEDRLLLGKLLFEETIETIVKGLGLRIAVNDGLGLMPVKADDLELHYNGDSMNPVEIVDGCADVNVVNHFMAHWIGFNLDLATEIVNDSNMSKLAEDGTPIINGVTPGYRTQELPLDGADLPERGYDPEKPIGKILKGPNFYEPTARLVAEVIIPQGGNA